MRVEDLIKAVCVVSGNDAAVALGEHLAGSEEAFVARMNERAKELGMNDTHFVNCTGLPADGHVTSAYDIALMSRELIWRHPDIRRFTTIWMDSLRGGASMLVNTNKLVRFTPARRAQDRLDRFGQILHQRDRGEGRHGAHRGHPGRQHE